MSTSFFETDDIERRLKSVPNFALDKVLDRQEPAGYAVILHNDPINGVDFVVRVISSVFGYGALKSTWLMLKAHFTGKSLLWLGRLDPARAKQAAMIRYGPDPNMRHKGARPLTVTVEKYR